MSWPTIENHDGKPFAPTLPALLEAAADSFAEREFLVLDDQRVSFAQAERISGEWAKGLLALGAGKGSRIGLLMPNKPDWALAFLACARMGGLCAALSTFYQPPELSWGLRHNDVDTLLIAARYLSNDYLERLERAIPGLGAHTSPELFLPSHPYLRRIVVWGECDRRWALPGPAALRGAASAKPQIDDALLDQIEAEIAPADPLVIICTSGSTAEPKAVVHTHGAATRAAHGFTHYIDVRPRDRLYTGQPLFWIGGLATALLPAMFMGACVCFSDSPAADRLAATILREGVTSLTLWPSQVAALLSHARAQGLRFDTVRSGLGAPLDEAGARIPSHRRNGGMLGMTESFGMHSLEKSTSAALPGKAGTWGRALPGVERRVVDPQTRAARGPGEVGELLVRGFSLMQGYYKREREEAFLPDGFFPTGDLVSIDGDGFLDFHGRSAEMIKTGGANVSPREVELALLALEDVQEAIVFGLEHPVKGEIVAAYVVARPGATPDAAQLRESLRSQISPYKVPQQIKFIAFDEVPRTGSQKVLKPQLKRMFTEDAAAPPRGRQEGP